MKRLPSGDWIGLAYRQLRTAHHPSGRQFLIIHVVPAVQGEEQELAQELKEHWNYRLFPPEPRVRGDYWSSSGGRVLTYKYLLPGPWLIFYRCSCVSVDGSGERRYHGKESSALEAVCELG